MQLAQQLANLGTETAFAVAAEANAWSASGNRVFPFHLGDINIPPPAAMIEAIGRALQAGKHGYCPGAGIPLLREQLARLISESRHVPYQAENIAVQPGGKPVIGKFLAAVTNAGDEVLYPVPGFPIYESQIRYQDKIAAPYFYRPTGGGFCLDIDSLRQAITPKTKALIYNNYHNPTGAAADADEINAVAALAQEHNLWVLADEAYFAIRFDGAPARTLTACADMPARTVILFTCSKQFAMTGWRVGAAIGPAEVINAIATMNTNMESCTTHFVQQAIGEALRDDAADDAAILAALKMRRDLLTEKLNTIDGVSVTAPPSGFYLYPDFSNIMQRKNFPTLEALRRATLQATGVAFCTGEHFGEAATTIFARFAFSGISEDAIEEGLTRLAEYYAN